ncbi:hypothetical protein MRB53_023373 [Persea americana]|uniref:Uncharacterized protein n=1 Tax=Persea americana TaxID=3435 RepID=A0ACC2L9V9_PERAE|nr:hypothetical protein MRB53_023373 [Persea americana]
MSTVFVRTFHPQSLQAKFPGSKRVRIGQAKSLQAKIPKSTRVQTLRTRDRALIKQSLQVKLPESSRAQTLGTRVRTSSQAYIILIKRLLHMLLQLQTRYALSPFKYVLGESGGSLQSAIVNCQIKWPPGPSPPYPEPLHQIVTRILQPQATVRPHIDDVIIHVDKLIFKFST